MNRTKEERFLLQIADLAHDRTDLPVDRYTVGRSLAWSHKLVDVISRDLMQTNFLKKGEEAHLLLLTTNGLALVRSLRQSS